MLCSRFAPITISSIQLLGVSEGPACCCGLAHEFSDDQQYVEVTGARSKFYNRETAVFHVGDGVFHVGASVHDRRPGHRVRVAVTVHTRAHSRPELWGSRAAASGR